MLVPMSVVGVWINGCTGARMDDKASRRGRGVDDFVRIR